MTAVFCVYLYWGLVGGGGANNDCCFLCVLGLGRGEANSDCCFVCVGVGLGFRFWGS